MNGTPLKLGLAAVALVAVALLGIRLLPGGVGAPPDPTPTPTPVTLASGSFTADLASWGQSFDIDATRVGDDVSGTLEVSSDEGAFSVDVQCARTRDDGLLVIAGEVTESTNYDSSEAAYAAILLEPGTPVRTILWLDAHPDEEDLSPVESCPALLERMFSDPEFLEMTGEDLAPIEGELELNP